MRRIGVAFPGDPSERATWSGTPFGVLTGLGAIGVEAVPINVQPAPWVQRAALNALSLRYLRPRRDVEAAIRTAREATRNSVELGRLSTAVAPRRIRAAAPLDGVIQIGTSFLLPRSVPVVTFEDMTVPQVRTHTYLGWDLFSERAYERRIDLQRRAYEQAVGVCLTSRWAARSAVDDYGIDPSRVHVVGVGQNHVAPAGHDRDWSTPRFLFVGLNWERKNGPAVLRAFARLREDVPAATLDLVGEHPAIEQPGVTGHGVLRLDDPEQHARVEQLFAAATCFVMPSLVEASAIAYVEAAAAGLPSIGSSSGGSDFLIGDGGLIVDPHDDDGLLAAMRALADPRVAAETGARAKRRSERFTWPEVARRLLHALSGAPPAPEDAAG